MNSFSEIISFIRQLYNQPTGLIPLHAPVFCGNEKKYLNDCIDSTFVSSVGQYVDRFEKMTAEFTGAKYAVATVNGTAALHMALMLAGVKPDDEVITQPLTFIATANAISYCGAKPVFLDVDLDTMGLSAEKLEHWLQNNTYYDTKTNKQLNKSTHKHITACVPMHTFGFPCRIDEIVEICNKYNIPVIEDAAESLGSYYKEKHTGTFGLMGTLSYNGNKTITTGGGGMIITDNEELAKKAKHLTTQAKVDHPWEYVHDQIGYNYRLPNINAALGCAQMESLPAFLAAKRKTAEAYKNFFFSLEQTTQQLNNSTNKQPNDLTTKQLNDSTTFHPPKRSEGGQQINASTHQQLNDSTNKRLNDSTFTFISEPPNSRPNYWLNCILLPNKAERDAFLEFSNKNGVMTRPVWQLMNKLNMFKECQTGDLCNAEWLADRLVNIPSSVQL